MEKNLKTRDGEKIEFIYDSPRENAINTLRKNDGLFSSTEFIEKGYINSYEYNEPLNIRFDSKQKDNDKWNYIASISSGILCGALDIFYVGNFSLNEASKWGNEKTKSFVIDFATLQGYKGNNIQGAILHLENKYEIPADKLTSEFGGGLQHHLRDFEHHPTLLGLFFSILTQFTHKGFGTDTSGNFIIRDIPNGAFVGETFEEKMFNGVVVWICHLISDVAGSNSNPGKGTGIPGPLLSSLKEISALPIIKDIKLKYENSNIPLSVFISKLFNGTYFKGETINDNIRFDLRTELGVIKEFGKQTIPVIINECLVRCLFMVRQFYLQVKEKNIKHFNELENIDFTKILPFNNKTLNRMLTISSGVFSIVDLSHATLCAAIKSKGDKVGFAKEFIVRINIPGFVRFVYAGKVEIDMLIEKQSHRNDMYDHRALPYLKDMVLDENKQRILFSLELLKCNMDLEDKTKSIYKRNKKEWIKQWINITTESLNTDESFFIYDENELKGFIRKELNNNEDIEWMYVVALEAKNFQPYYPLNSEFDKDFKKLRYRDKDFDKKIIELQYFINSKDLKNINKYFKKYTSIISGKRTAKQIGVISTTVLSIATGVGSFFFASKIAALLVGGTFTGLHGAALTSASLAFIGGGALAVGGYGMVGGTVVITGGGALLGLTSSGLTTLTSTLLLSNDKYTLREASKLLTFIKISILDRCRDVETAEKLVVQLENKVEEIELKKNELPDAVENKKKTIAGMNRSVTYLKRAINQLNKEIKKLKKHIK